MNTKIFAVIKREFGTRVRTKGFMIGTLIFPLILIFLFAGIFIFDTLFQPSTKNYYIVDQTGRVYDDFVAMLPDTLKNGEPKYLFTQVQVQTGELENEITRFAGLVLAKEIDGYFIIPEDLIVSRAVKYSGRSVSNFDEQRRFRSALRQIVTNLRFERIGLSAEEIRREMSLGWVNLESIQVTKSGEVQKDSRGSFFLAYILAFIIYFSIIIYGQILMRSVIEEKSQRITETIISSMKPIELMVGKIVGICLLGIVQLGVVSIFMLVLSSFAEPIFAGLGLNIPNILNVIQQVDVSPSVLLFLLVFFFLGFIFYSTLYAVAGSIVNSEDEGQQYQMPIVFIVLIAYMTMFTVAQNPDTTMAYWVSLIPFFTPIVMFARVVASDPILPSGIFISLIVLCVSTILFIMLTAKIYRIGILMYGKKPSIKEVIKWIKYK